MMFTAMLVDAWRQTRDQWIQWVLYAAIVLVLVGLALIPIDWLIHANGRSPTAGQLFTDAEKSLFVWSLIKSITANWVGGFVGVIIAIVMTAGQLPAMLRPGGIDLVTSFPHARWKLLLAKFLGGVVFVAWYAVLLIGGVYLVSGVRGGGWEPKFLLAIPIMLLSFITLYSISLLMAVLFRNAVMVILGTLAMWALATVLGFFTNSIFYQMSYSNYEHARKEAYRTLESDNQRLEMLARVLRQEERKKEEAEAKKRGEAPPPMPPGEELREHHFQQMTREEMFADGEFYEHIGDMVRLPSFALPKMHVFDEMVKDLSIDTEVKTTMTEKLNDFLKQFAPSVKTDEEPADAIDLQATERLRVVYAKQSVNYWRDGLTTAGFVVVMLLFSCVWFSRTDY